MYMPPPLKSKCSAAEKGHEATNGGGAMVHFGIEMYGEIGGQITQQQPENAGENLLGRDAQMAAMASPAPEWPEPPPQWPEPGKNETICTGWSIRFCTAVCCSLSG